MQHRALLVRQDGEWSNVEWRAQLAAQDANRPGNSVPWALERKPHSSFLFYKLKDGQRTWLIYIRLDRSNRMVPLPEKRGFFGN